jgi:hypothetical protein
MPIHFIHEPGKGPNPAPIILKHGWPWTFCADGGTAKVSRRDAGVFQITMIKNEKQG